MQPNLQKLLEDLDQTPGEQKDAFRETIGPTEDCLSSARLVELFLVGAKEHDLAHLRSCTFCMERVNRYAKVTQQVLPLEETQGWFAAVKRLFRPVCAVPSYSALLYVESADEQVISLGPDNTGVFTIRVIAPTDLVRSVDAQSLQLSGAVVAKECELYTDKDVPTICFANVSLSDQLREDFRHSSRVTESVRLTGRLRDAVGQILSAQADVTFVRAEGSVNRSARSASHFE